MPQSKSTQLCSPVVVVPQSKSPEMWGSAAPFHHDLWYFRPGQTNILSLCYLFWKTYKQPIVAQVTEINTLYQTYNCTYWGRPYDITSLQGFFIMMHRFCCNQSLRLKYAMIKLKHILYLFLVFVLIIILTMTTEEKVKTCLMLTHPKSLHLEKLLYKSYSNQIKFLRMV